MVDLMDDEKLKKSVIDQMMNEVDGVTSDSLKKKPDGPVKGVEIAITVSPKSGDEMKEAVEDAGEGECMDPECDDPMHDHAARDAVASEPASDDYIGQLLKKLG